MSVASRVRGACAALTLCSAIGMSPPTTAAEMPAYMGIVVAGPSPGETARQNVLALNAAMFGLYGNSGKVFGRNILAQHPVILGLFTGEGGRFILYRPGKATLEAPSVPVVYQLLKSVGHSTMVLPVLAGPYIDKPEDQSWRAPMAGFRAALQAALDGLLAQHESRDLGAQHCFHRRMPRQRSGHLCG